MQKRLIILHSVMWIKAMVLVAAAQDHWLKKVKKGPKINVSPNVWNRIDKLD